MEETIIRICLRGRNFQTPIAKERVFSRAFLPFAHGSEILFIDIPIFTACPKFLSWAADKIPLRVFRQQCFAEKTAFVFIRTKHFSIYKWFILRVQQPFLLIGRIGGADAVIDDEIVRLQMDELADGFRAFIAVGIRRVAGGIAEMVICHKAAHFSSVSAHAAVA